jgi:signal transduction histidine kinase
MTESEKKRSPRVRNLILFSLLIMVLFCSIVIFQTSQSHRAAIETARANSARLLRIMEQEVELTLLGVDNSLHRAVERQYYNGLFGGTLSEDMLHNMQLWVNESPRIAALVLVDANGLPVVSAYKEYYANWLDYAHRSFASDRLFRQVREGTDAERFIGYLQVNAGAEPKTLILLARKIVRTDGSFGGAFIAAIDPAFFVDYFHSVDQGRKSYIALRMNDSGALLVDSPVKRMDHGELNRQVLAELQTGPPPSDEPVAGPVVGPMVGKYSKGDDTQIYAYARLKTFPVLVTVSLDEEDYLRAWRQSSWKDIGFLAIFMVFGSVLSFLAFTMARQIVRVEESEAAAVLASQAKSEFLANMSHELRTPLNAIIGFSEMMNSGYFGPLNTKQKERIHDINLCGSHLLHLITDILEFSKGDAGKLELAEEKVNLQEIVGETLRMMNDRIKVKRMKMLLEIDAKLPMLLADKRKIRQILLNLLSNSLKFTPEDGTIKVAVRQDSSGNIMMTISDTGIGIAEEDIPTALSVFGQVHRNQSHEGTGLGLPLCKMFAELHGGRLAIGSTPGQGTTVRIIFPASRNLYMPTRHVQEMTGPGFLKG